MKCAERVQRNGALGILPRSASSVQGPTNLQPQRECLGVSRASGPVVHKVIPNSFVVCTSSESKTPISRFRPDQRHVSEVASISERSGSKENASLSVDAVSSPPNNSTWAKCSDGAPIVAIGPGANDAESYHQTAGATLTSRTAVLKHCGRARNPRQNSTRFSNTSKQSCSASLKLL